MLFKCYYAVLYLFWVILPWPVVTALTVLVPVKKRCRFRKIFVAFSEYMNFTIILFGLYFYPPPLKNSEVIYEPALWKNHAILNRGYFFTYLLSYLTISICQVTHSWDQNYQNIWWSTIFFYKVLFTLSFLLDQK